MGVRAQGRSVDGLGSGVDIVQDMAVTVPDIDPEASGLGQRVWDNAAQNPTKVQFVRPAPVSRAWPVRRSVRGGDVPVTCAQFRDDVTTLARGFVAAGIGPATASR